MNNKKLALLGIIAVLMTGAVILQHQIGRNVHMAEFSSSALIEGLAIDSVAAIQITSPNESQIVKLVRGNGQFVVSDKDNYPVDVGKINDLINKCLDIRTIETITSNPDNHADLKVTEETARYLIAFLDREKKSIATVALSEVDPETNTAHARLLSGNDVYSIRGAPWFNTQAIDYIDTELLSVPLEKVSSVAVKTSDSSYVLSSPEGTDEVSLEKMPEGKQYRGTVYQTVFGALSSLRFEDVSAPSNVPQELDFDKTYICKLYDLTVYKLSIAEKDDKTYIKISADFLDKAPVEKTVGEVESDEELKKKEAKLLAIDAVKEFNAMHKEWVYQIPSYKAEQLIKPLSALIEDIPQPEEKSEPLQENAAETSENAVSEG
ncbi:MAG: DUF4340 domain-containing protein [Phycisphaerae bacterium]|nr:DUF4340 domain-containing protein [Phycisphaerae bacterium]